MRHFIFVLAAALISAEAMAASIVIGPIIRDVGPDRVVIGFQTDVPVAASIEIGTTDAYGTVIASSSGTTWHSVQVTGLLAKSMRHYRVLLNGVPSGRAGTFVTAPAAPEPFTFLLYGDTRSNPEAHALVVSRMLEHPAAFAINTGDLVENGSSTAMWTQFTSTVSSLVGDMALLAVVGNHDLDGDGPPDSFLQYAGPPTSAADPKTYGIFDYAGVRLILLDRFYAAVIDSNCYAMTGSFEYCMNSTQRAWLLAQLGAARDDPTVRHVLIVVHEGPYSSKPGRIGSTEMRLLLNDMARSKVRMILSGHDHYYEHGIAGNGLHYVVSGGGGAPLYETEPSEGPDVPPHKVLMSTSTYNFQRVIVNGDSFEITSYQADGTEMESFEVTVPPACSLPADCAAPASGSCEGKAECSNELRCVWACTPPPQCADASECEIRTPDESCSGAWACLDTNCVWECNTPPDPGPGDLGTNDVSTVVDVPQTDLGSLADTGPVTPPDPAPAGGGGGGCASGQNTAPPLGFLAPLLLIVSFVLRFRGRARRS